MFLLDQQQHLEKEKRSVYVIEQDVTTQEVSDKMQETITLDDTLKEVDVLERRLKEVRGLEERLQQVKELEERIQEVIEKELGKEEVARLKREELLTQDKPTETIIRTTQIREGEVDEPEDEIKKVFLKGLLPEEEEIKLKQSIMEPTDKSVITDSLREQLGQREKEWRDDVEKELGLSDIVGTSVVEYKMVERKTKSVTIVDEREQVDSELVPGEKVETKMIWSKTEVMEEKGFRSLTPRLWKESLTQGEEKEAWFILFDHLPYEAVFKPPGTVYHCTTAAKLYFTF